MDQKKKRCILAITAVFVLGLFLIRPGYYLYRELEYRLDTPTRAEETVYTHAWERGIPYGSYPREKWDNNLALKRYFEEKTKRDIYDVVK